MSTTVTQAASELRALQGEDLMRLGRRNGTIARGQVKLDKGWANRTVRATLNGYSEGVQIRTVPMRQVSRTEVAPASAIALGQIDLDELVRTPFMRSRLRAALSNVLLVARESDAETKRPRSRILGVSVFNLDDSSLLLKAVQRDYERIRKAVKAGDELNGHMGVLVQPRTKGRGGDSRRTYGFYARPALVSQMLGLSAA